MSLPPHDQIAREICSFISLLIGRECAPTDDLRERGVDSVAFLELVIFIEKRFSVPLPLELITSGQTSTPALLAKSLLALEHESTPA